MDNGLKKKIVEIINQKLDLSHYKIFLFGSRINGTADERSDIDIGIQSLDSYLPTGVISDLQLELDEKLPILQKIDLVDFNNVAEDFKKVALQNIEVIYER